VRAPRVLECPVQLEARVVNIHAFQSDDSHLAGVEVRIVRAYFDDSILNPEKRHHVDNEKWNPLIMSFCEFYGLGENVHGSRLAKVF
jgi:flavin reductase (DIM6/NTAB) family NADH-FMN oxidoreductase RutF